MPSRRATLLSVLLCLLVAAPAAASERSEARRYAAAMEPKIVLTPEEGEALVADYEARSAHVAVTCLDSVKAATKRDESAITVLLLYLFHSLALSFDQEVAWQRQADDRLAAIPTSSPTLRRGRAARRAITRSFSKLVSGVPSDFCGMVTAWQAKRFKGMPPGAEHFYDEDGDSERVARRLRRATVLLGRHGATRGQLRAFNGVSRWPDLREPAEDLVLKALEGPKTRDPSPDGGGSRTPW